MTHSKIEFSWECIDLVNKLLVKEPKDRIGFLEGVKEVKKHDWFLGFDWAKFARKEVQAPFKPVVRQGYAD